MTLSRMLLSLDAVEGEGVLEGDLQVRVRVLGQTGMSTELVHRTARADLGDAQAVARAASRIVSSIVLSVMAPELDDVVEEVAGGQ